MLAPLLIMLHNLGLVLKAITPNSLLKKSFVMDNNGFTSRSQHLAAQQLRTEKLQAQYKRDEETFKEKMEKKEAMRREEILRRTEKYAGYVLGHSTPSKIPAAQQLHVQKLQTKDVEGMETIKFRQQQKKTETQPGQILGRNSPLQKTAGQQLYMEKLQAQYEKDMEKFKIKQEKKEAMRREEFLRKTEKYAGNVLGGGVTPSNNISAQQLRMEKLQAQYNKDMQTFKDKQEKI